VVALADCHICEKAPYANLNDKLRKARSEMLEAKELSGVIIQGLKRAKARAQVKADPKNKKRKVGAAEEVNV
jgi:hypothetical protein